MIRLSFKKGSPPPPTNQNHFSWFSEFKLPLPSSAQSLHSCQGHICWCPLTFAPPSWWLQGGKVPSEPLLQPSPVSPALKPLSQTQSCPSPLGGLLITYLVFKTQFLGIPFCFDHSLVYCCLACCWPTFVTNFSLCCCVGVPLAS